jgi:hypothetical protein
VPLNQTFHIQYEARMKSCKMPTGHRNNEAAVRIYDGFSKGPTIETAKNCRASNGQTPAREDDESQALCDAREAAWQWR